MTRALLRTMIFAGLLALGACGRAPVAAPPHAAEDGSRVVTARGPLAESENATIAVFEKAAPSVVLVVARAPSMLGGDTGEIGGGSGFIWDDEGHVVTNNHVAIAPQVLVHFANGEDIRATVIGRAPQYDVAVLRLARKPTEPALAIGASAGLKVGQSVYAIGNPFGLDQTLTSGIVSAVGRRLPTQDGREISDVIQTDAAINPGNSGGPLLDSAARVIGMNTAIVSPSGAYAGIGFAVPIDTVARVVPQLIQSGRAPVPGIGIEAADEAAAAQLGVEGVIVYRVVPDMPAAHAGIVGVDSGKGALGDVIVGVNGHDVKRLADLTNELERVGVGATVQLSIKRGDETRTVSLPVEDIGAR
jgi:S1-C subfamily serine protease